MVFCRFAVKIERCASLKGAVPASLLNSADVKVDEDTLSFKVISVE